MLLIMLLEQHLHQITSVQLSFVCTSCQFQMLSTRQLFSSQLQNKPLNIVLFSLKFLWKFSNCHVLTFDNIWNFQVSKQITIDIEQIWMLWKDEHKWKVKDKSENATFRYSTFGEISEFHIPCKHIESHFQLKTIFLGWARKSQWNKFNRSGLIQAMASLFPGAL